MSKYAVGQTYCLDLKNLPLSMHSAARRFAELAYVKLIEQSIVAGVPTGGWVIEVKSHENEPWRMTTRTMDETMLKEFYVEYEDVPKYEDPEPESSRLSRVIED